MDRLSRARGTICLSFSCVHAGRGSASLPGLAWGAPSYSGLCWMGSRAVLGEKEGGLYSNRDERKLKSMGKLEPSRPSLPLTQVSRHLYLLPPPPLTPPSTRHHPAPALGLLDWCGNPSWDPLGRYVTVQNAICPFPLPVKTRQPTCHLGTLRPAVLWVFGNDGFQTTSSEWLVMLTLRFYPLQSASENKTNQNKHTSPQTFSMLSSASRTCTCGEINQANIISPLAPRLPWKNAWCACIYLTITEHLLGLPSRIW